MTVRLGNTAAFTFSVVLFATVGFAADEPSPDHFDAIAAPFLSRYCARCHGGEKPKADLNLSAFKGVESVLQGRKVWSRLLEYVEAGEMPPQGEAQPTEEEASKFLEWGTTALKQVDCASQSDPGRVTIRRLNRAEYNNTIRDLIGVSFRPADDFPSDDVGYGFDNIGDVLTLPPILLEKYLEAAEAIVDEAIVAGPGNARPRGTTIEVEDLPPSVGGNPYRDFGRILASNGVIATKYSFPRDAEYVLRARAFGQQAGPEPVKLAIQVDGKALRTFEVKAVESSPQVVEHRAKLKGGSRSVGVAFLNDFYNANDPDPKRRDRNLVVDWVEIVGPIDAKGAPLPDSHRRIIFKKPTKEDRATVAREIIERFASRAYRRPVAPGEVARLVKFVDLAAQNGDTFERGIQLAVQAILVSPQFLFRVELDLGGGRKGGAPKGAAPATLISEFELASRLSYFLWSSMPDDELYRLALDGKLRQGDNLDKQVLRMLQSPKSIALVENFAGQWLQTRNLKAFNPDRKAFPTFDESLRAAMVRETDLYFASIIKADRSVLDLIDSDYTFVNERLAKHYGLPGVAGDEFRRVSLKGTSRGGLLTQASILAVTSNPTRTSPVKRGKWVLEQFLGTPPPPPPPEVPDLKEEEEGKPLAGTLRQRMEQHRSNPSCASCHARMDPIGFGLENFNAIGAWRDQDGGATIDPSGTLPSGQKFRGPTELKAILKSRENEFTRCLSEKLLTYAIGRGLEYYDACAVDTVVENVSRKGHRFSQLVLEIVKSDPFQKRKAKEVAR